jgi:hypothetical protein
MAHAPRVDRRNHPRPAVPSCFFVPWGQNRGQNPFTYSPRMAELLEFFDRPMEPRDGFELSVPGCGEARRDPIAGRFIEDLRTLFEGGLAAHESL